jgi:hypothetical protein
LALTLQRKLELAGDLAKVQPLLQRLHLVEKPKKHFGGRSVILVSSVIGAVTLALAAVAVRRRLRRLDGAVAGDRDDPRADSPNEDALPTTGDLLAPL